MNGRPAPPAGLFAVTREVLVDAPRERVWTVLTDLEHLPRLLPTMLAARWADGVDEAGLGAWFVSTNAREDLGAWTAESRVVVFRPYDVVAWTIESATAPAAVCRFDLSDADGLGAGARRTLLCQSYLVDPRLGAVPPVDHCLAGWRP